MKKLMLSLLGLSMVGVAATSVVSCSTPTKNMDINLSELGDNLTIESFNGGSNSAYSGGISFTTLISQFTNLFTITHYMYTTDRDFNKHHKLFIGNDQTKDLSVDGIAAYASQEDERKAFYDQYNDSSTSIASLEGIYEYNKVEKDSTSSVATLDTDDTVVNEFFNNFLGKNKGAPDSYFESVTISTTSGASIVDKDSAIFAEVESDSDGNNIKFSDATSLTSQTFKEINTAIDSDDNTIGNSVANPFSLATLGASTQQAPTSFSKTDDKHSGVDEGRIQDDWNMHYTSDGETEKFDGDYSKLVDCGDVVFDYTYNSDSRNDNATKYDIKVTVSGLQAVYTPVYSQTDKAEGEDNKICVAWEFSGYQFNNKVDTNHISAANEGKATYGSFSDIKITDLEITKK